MKKLTDLYKSDPDSEKFINSAKKFIRIHPFSVYNDMVRIFLLLPEIRVQNETAILKLIKNNYMFRVSESSTDILIYDLFLLKESGMQDAYELLLLRIQKTSWASNFMQKFKYAGSTSTDNLPIDYREVICLKTIFAFNTAVNIQPKDNKNANDLFRECYSFDKSQMMKNLILKRGGLIEKRK